MKLIHISDTHIGHGENASRLKEVIDHLLDHPPGGDPENCLVIHTGDLIDSATDENRQLAKELLDRLANRYQVLLCPGNHDYGDKTGIDEEAARAFCEEFSCYIFDGEQQDFPVLHQVNDKYVFIGLDSNAAELNCWEKKFAEGHLGSSQLDKLNCLLDSDQVRNKQVIVYLHHHPFYYGYSVMPDVGDKNPFFHLFAWVTRSFRRLKDAYTLCQITRDRVQVLLFGHMHHGLDCSGESRKYGIRLALDGGSTTCTEDDLDRMRYRVIDLSDITQPVRTLMIPIKTMPKLA